MDLSTPPLQPPFDDDRRQDRMLLEAQGYVGDYSPISREGHFLLESWAILKARKWGFLVTLVIVFALVAFATVRATPLYEAVGRVVVNRETPLDMGTKDSPAVNDDDWDYNVALETQVRVMRSDAVALGVVKNLKLQDNRAFTGDMAALKTSELPLNGIQLDSPQQTELIGRVKSGLKVSVVPRTRILEIQYTSADPKLAAAIVNGYENAFIEQNIKTRFDSVNQTSDWLSGQLADLELKVETSQQKLVRYQKEHGILGLDDKQNIVTSKLDEINQELTAAQADRIEKESIYRLSQAGDPESVAKTDTNSVVDKLREQEDALKSQYAQLDTQFGPAYPKVQEVANQLKQTQTSIQKELKRIAARAQGQYLAAVQRERLLQAALDRQKQEANQLNESAVEYSLLKRDAESNRQLYEGLLEKLKEAGVAAGLRSSNIQIVDLARVPSAPSSPRIPRNLAIGLFLGLVAGIGVAFVEETLDNTLKTPEEAQTIAMLPAVGLIPLASESDARDKVRGKLGLPAGKQAAERQIGPISLRRPRSEAAEAFRALRTSLLLSSAGEAPKVILLTSPLPQEGKTTASVNTAVVLAQGGKRVLLVDGDMRRPSVHCVLGIVNDVGLSTALAGGVRAESAIQSTGVPNLFVIPAGPPPPDPSELLSSNLMSEFLARWRNEFDHVVIDSPPMLSVTDPVALSVHADVVLLVVRMDQTAKAALRRAREILGMVKARVLGVVVNGLDLHKSSYYSYYYFGYGYRSKYGSYYHETSDEQEPKSLEEGSATRPS